MSSALGPAVISTLKTSDYDVCIEAWCHYLWQNIHSETELSNIEAEKWGVPHLVGSRVAWIENMLGEPWLRIVEDRSARLIPPFSRSGWLSLEICVENVDTLYSELKNSPFEIIGKPADLDVSPDIRAMQVLGPANEVLYLTQIKACVPGFDLPFARCPVDRLFIPILLTHNRDSALATYTEFSDTQGVLFETKITVLNQALGLPFNQRHPVATLQLSGKNLIEIDELEGLKAKNKACQTMSSGIISISFALRDFDELTSSAESYLIPAGPFAGKRANVLVGFSGECIELIEWDVSMDEEPVLNQSA